ncbi:peptidoglycan D,D-transpeptidase FtsI family protein [Thermoproteota archaeon]
MSIMKRGSYRFGIILLSLYAVVFVLLSRLFYLQIYNHEFFKSKSEDQLKRIIRLYPHRGNIYDRNMVPMALTEPCYSAYAMPAQIEGKWAFSAQFARLTNGSKRSVYKKINNKYPFVWLKRKLTSFEYRALKELSLKGLDFIKEEKRVFPHQNLASSILGFVGIDNQGLGGLEYQFDHYLRGNEGKIILEGDPRGKRLVTGVRKTVESVYNGGNIVTTIDNYLQYIAERELKKGIIKQEASGGQVVIMNPQNGDILALVDYPYFNPNNWSAYPYSNLRNSCVTDVFEPGSVLKIITVSAVLEEGLFEPETVLKVPEKLVIAGCTIKEAHKRDPNDTDRKSVADIIIESLNVGSTLLAEQLGAERLYKYYKDFGFGQVTNIDLPGESCGLLRPLSQWSGVDYAMLSFGQGIAATPLQIACAIGAIANKGLRVQPRIIRQMTDYQSTTLRAVPFKSQGRVVSRKTAEKVIKIMVDVVEKGTAEGVKVPGLAIAGKTGTAQKPRKDGRGYEKDKYIASFVGFFPADNPKYLILVMVDSPQKKIYGSSVAGPVFKGITDAVIHYDPSLF